MTHAPNRVRFIAIALMSCQLGLFLTAALRSSPTSDEFGHFYAGLVYWRCADTTLFKVNPPLIRALATVSADGVDWSNAIGCIAEAPPERPEFLLGRNLFSRFPRLMENQLLIGRITVACFSLVGTYALFFWAYEMAGLSSAIAAACFWIFQPQVIGHGALITNDVPVAAWMLLATWRFNRWIEELTFSSAVGGGCVLGIATLCKFTALLLWPVFAAFTTWFAFKSKNSTKNRSLVLIQACVAVLVAWVVIGIPYGFQGVGNRIPQDQFVSQLFRGQQGLEAPAISIHQFFRCTPSLLPHQFVLGLDRQQLDFETGLISYARGERSYSGWWWFYLYTMLVKLPIGTLIAIALATIFWIGNPRMVTREIALVAVVVFAMGGITAWKSGFSQQSRYILPLYPFLCLLLAVPIGLADKSRRWRFWRYGLVASLAISVFGCLLAAPDWLSSFNRICGGSANGYRHLFNDATDWGQDTRRVVQWVHEHPECRPLRIHSINGMSRIDPESLGLPGDLDQSEKSAFRWWIISKSDLVVVDFLKTGFLDREPVEQIGDTHFVYCAPNTHREGWSHPWIP